MSEESLLSCPARVHQCVKNSDMKIEMSLYFELNFALMEKPQDAQFNSQQKALIVTV